MKIAHISKYRRHSPGGVHTGGVAKFGWYLQQAVRNLHGFAWEDLPDWQEYELKSQDWDKAPLLNAWLLKEGHIDKDTTVIVDGFWGLGLEGKVYRLISVCHGSFAGAMVEHMKNPWDNGFLLGQSVRHQEAFWRDSGCEIVTVSHNVDWELTRLSGVEASVIIQHGIDMDIFHPAPPLPEPGLILEVTGGHPAKGSMIIEELRGMGYNIEPFGVTSGDLKEEAERWSSATVALFPSHYEGCSYALIEAMSRGCNPVSYLTGLARDLPSECGEFIDDYSVEAFAHAIDRALLSGYEGLPSSNWDFDVFAARWAYYLGYTEKEETCES